MVWADSRETGIQVGRGSARSQLVEEWPDQTFAISHSESLKCWVDRSTKLEAMRFEDRFFPASG